MESSRSLLMSSGLVLGFYLALSGFWALAWVVLAFMSSFRQCTHQGGDREVKLTSTLTSYIVMSDCHDDLEVLAC